MSKCLRSAIVLVLFVTFIPRSSVAQDTPDETIVFTTLRPANQDIYLVDEADSEPRRLTDHLGLDYNPAFSPDGRGLVFPSDRDGNADLFVMPFRPKDPVAAEDKAQNLTQHPFGDFQPAFSPDGTWILFISGRSGINDEGLLASGPQPYGELWAIPVEGGSPIRLTHDKWEDGLARWGAWR